MVKVRTGMFAAAVSLALIAPGIGLAQEATPGTTTASCEDVPARNERDLQTLSGTPPAPVGTPEGEPTAVVTPFAMPEGEAASEEDLSAAVDLYQTLTDCANTGDFLRIASLYTDQYLVQNLSPELIENLDQTPEPNQESAQTEFVEIREARYLDPDRLAVLVITRNPNTGELQTYAELARSGEGWLVDHEQPIEVGDATPAA